MIGTSQIKEMGEFYHKVIGRPADMTEGGWYGWQVGKCFIGIGEHSEVHGTAKEPQRMIFNFESKEVKEEFERIKATGATVVKEPYAMGDGWIATFSDPDGNYFQLMSPMGSDK
jgi:predicted enzyme related to lactoylglutathione lyase